MSSTKTVYTATIALPVYAAWKCQKCNEINFSTGTIVCQRQAQSSTSLFGVSQEEAKARAMSLVQQEWADDALGIMNHIEQHTTEAHEHLKMGSTTCTNCKKKPKWSKGVGLWTPFMCAASLIGIITLIMIFVFSLYSSLAAWIIVGVCSCIVAAGIAKGISYKNTIKSLSKEYAPVFGTTDPELREYARAHGETIPTPEEAVEIVTNNGERPVAVGETNDESNEGVGQHFCRKCGTVLPEDGVCPNCGTQYVEN